MKNRFLRDAVAALLVLGMGFVAMGCATVSRDVALDVAKQGTATAQAQKEAFKEISDRMEFNLRGYYLVAPLIDVEREKVDKYKDEIETVTMLLALRSAVLDSLINAYGAYASFAEYNAREDYQEALGTLSGSISNFASVASPGVSGPVTAALGDIMVRVGAMAAAHKQSERLRIGSVFIREQLAELNKVLEDETRTYMDMYVGAIGHEYTLAMDLYFKGFGTPVTLISSYVQSSGLDADPKLIAAAIQAHADDVQEGASAALARGMNLEKRLASELLAKQQQSFLALVKAHESLEAGQPMNVAQLQALIEDFGAIAVSLRELHETKEPESTTEEDLNELVEALKEWQAVLTQLRAAGLIAGK